MRFDLYVYVLFVYYHETYRPEDYPSHGFVTLVYGPFGTPQDAEGFFRSKDIWKEDYIAYDVFPIFPPDFGKPKPPDPDPDDPDNLCTS